LTAENRARLAALTLQMIAWLKVELACLFVVLQWSIIDSVRQGEGKLSPAFVPVFLAVVFSTLGCHIAAMFRTARKRA
jgi:hypothetical protein